MAKEQNANKQQATFKIKDIEERMARLEGARACDNFEMCRGQQSLDMVQDVQRRAPSTHIIQTRTNPSVRSPAPHLCQLELCSSAEEVGVCKGPAIGDRNRDKY